MIDLRFELLRSIIYRTIDASLVFFKAFSIPIFSILSYVYLNPAVSINLTVFPPNVMVSSIISLVVPGISEIIAFSSFNKPLRIVDFPTLGFPRIIILIQSFITLFSL